MPPPGTHGGKSLAEAAECIFLAGAVAGAAEALVPGTGAPGWVLPAAEIIAGAGSSVVTWAGTGRWFPLPGYLAAFSGFLGGWTIWAQSAGLFTGPVVTAWLAGMATMIPAGMGAWARRRRREAPATLPMLPPPVLVAPEPPPEEMERLRFESMFAGLLGITPDDGVRVTALEEGGAGRVVHLRLQRSGRVTITDLRSLEGKIEVILRLRPGSVSFGVANSADEIIMRLRERDGLAIPGTLTPDLLARTVNEPFVIGYQDDASALRLLLREIHMLVSGTTGSGKSNLMNLIVSQLAHCVDNVTWMIDLKGGRTGKPWFQAWEDCAADRPAIDWLATTREEAALMMDAVLAAIDARMNSGLGANKITPSASMPQITLICDEMAIILGSERGTRLEVGESGVTNGQFITKAETVAQLGRSEAVDCIWCTQRGTASMGGSGDLKALLKLRLALKPSDESQVRWSVPDAPQHVIKKLMALAETPGVGILANGAACSEVTKFLHHDHIEGRCGSDQRNPRCVPECPVYRSAVEVGPMRPALDRLTAAPLGRAYAERWERASAAGVIKVPAHALGRSSAPLVDLSQFDEIVSDVEDRTHPARLRMLELLRIRGALGATPKWLCDRLAEEGFTFARESVSRWLLSAAQESQAHTPEYGRWKFGRGPNHRPIDPAA